MRGSSILIACVTLSALSACETTNIRKAELAPGSSKAGVIMKLERAVPVKQSLDLVGFDSTSVDEEGRVKLRNTGADLKLNKGDGGYVFTTINPGTYLIARLVQQDAWAGCFQDGTATVTIAPDTVTYIGRFDPVKNSKELLAEATRIGRLRASPDNPVSMFEGMSEPALVAGNESELNGVRQYLSENAAGVTLPVVLETPKTGTTFRTGRNIYGGRICMKGL